MRQRTGRLLTAALVLSLIASPSLSISQEADDWDFAEDISRKLTVATASYSAGTSIIVHCQDGELNVVMLGLPASHENLRRLDATRSDGTTDTQAWVVGEGKMLTSNMPSRDARFLRVGGALRLRSSAGQPSPISASFELPTQHANLDRVISGCGYELENDRDRIPRADPQHRLTRKPPRSEGGRPGHSIEVSCLVRAGAYQECRADHVETNTDRQSIRGGVNSWNRARVHLEDATANEGRVVYIFIPLLLMVYD